MAFYDIFEQQCREKGVTPTQAARENDIRQSVVSMWKTRGSTPKAETVQKLADYFGVSIYMLLGDNEREVYQEAEVNLVKANVKAGYKFTTDEKLLVRLFHQLNETGKDAAIERVGDLTEIPRYRAETAPQSSPLSSECQSTTPPPDVPEAPPEGE